MEANWRIQDKTNKMAAVEGFDAINFRWTEPPTRERHPYFEPMPAARKKWE